MPDASGDSDWKPIDLTETTDSDESEGVRQEGPGEHSESDDLEWCCTVPSMPTWKIDEDLGVKVSNRCKFQLKPLVL